MEIGQWLMETSVGSWIMHIPSNMFIPFWLLYALAIFIVGICLIAARRRAAIRIQAKHIPAPVLTLQDLAAFSNLSAFHVTALRLYERYLKGEVRIRQEDFYIHEMNESDEDTEDAQTPIQYLKAHTQKSSIVADARPSNSDYSRMLSAGNQVSFSKYQKGYNKRCSIVRRPVIWGSVVLIYLPILIRMNIGIYRGKAVRNLEAVMILGAFGLFIGYLLVSISDGSRVQDSFQSACRKAAEEAFPRRDGMDSLVLKAEENAASLTDEERRMLLTSYAMGYMRRIQTDSGVAIPTMLFSAAEMLYKQEVAERAKKNAGSTNSCSSCSTRRYDRFLRCWARSGSTSALAC